MIEIDTTALKQDQTFQITDEQTRAVAVESAFRYRGDVTIETNQGNPIVGYLFDRNDLKKQIRLYPADGGEQIKLPYDQIQTVTLTGRDLAAGRSWDDWIKQNKQLQGTE